ncbi:MAG: hypothetical protein ABII27_08930 [bacterium]
MTPYIAAQENSGLFLISPMIGRIDSDIQYNVPGTSSRKTLNDSGPIYALMMMYTRPQFTIGNMGHYSNLDKSTENGYMFYGLYYFRYDANIRPMIGFYADYINVLTKATSSDVPPLQSLNVNTSIWAFHPIAGVSLKLGTQKIAPFIGYFNEQIENSLSSEGMRIAGQVRNGFTADSSVDIDYMTAGIKAELNLMHFIRCDTKIYARLRSGEKALFTSRNRIDFLVSKNSGISIKYDYFDDKYEKNSFLLIGPVFVF